MTAVIVVWKLKRICRQFSTGHIQLIEDTEVKEFYQGSLNDEGEGGQKWIPEVQKMAYNKDLELKKSEFKLELDCLLGSGTFGSVYQGIVTRACGNNDMKVAVKTTKPNSPSTTVSGLLSEIKVLSYLGKHENLVCLVGAYTKGVKRGKIYLFFELCELGSLEKYLRERILPESEVDNLSIDEGDENGRQALNILINDDELSQSITYACDDTPHPLDKPKTKIPTYAADLYRWSKEIVTAMEFLATKNVVHADLATRNILLTHDKRVKLSDFGLSRRLYEYTMYVKTQQEPLPWRSMAPESLCRSEFTEKSDVWAYGVTIWEIYSLGNIPFEGLSWTPSFSSQLSLGLRLQEPSFNCHGMYSHMLKCWNVSPCKRPTFSELKSIFE